MSGRGRPADPASPADPGAPIELSPDALSPAALRGLVEEFASRDGTDYGEVERSLEEKVRDVRRQLERGEARIVFDPGTETANIVGVEGRKGGG